MIRQHRDDEVGVQRAETGSGVIEHQEERVADQLKADGQALPLRLRQLGDVERGDGAEGDVGEHLLHSKSKRKPTSVRQSATDDRLANGHPRHVGQCLADGEAVDQLTSTRDKAALLLEEA